MAPRRRPPRPLDPRSAWLAPSLLKTGVMHIQTRSPFAVVFVSALLFACAPAGRGGGGGGGGGAPGDGAGEGDVAPGAGGDLANGDHDGPQNNGDANGAGGNADDGAAGVGDDEEGLDVVDGDGDGRDDEPAAPARTGDDSCEDVRICAGNCAEADDDCIVDCVSFGTPEAQETFQSLQLCNAINGCGWDGDCLVRNCREDDANCSVAVDDPDGQAGGGGDGGFGGGGGNAGGGGGGGTCGGIFQCLGGCGEDEACAGACVQAASPDAQRQFQSLTQCLQTLCAQADGEDAFMACAETECGAELNACFADGGAGGGGSGGGGDGGGGDGGGGNGGGGNGDELTCTGIFQCGQACPDEACFQGCVQDATPAAQQQFTDIAQCLDDNCAAAANDQAAMQQCAEDNCPGELEACFGR